MSEVAVKLLIDQDNTMGSVKETLTVDALHFGCLVVHPVNAVIMKGWFDKVMIDWYRQAQLDLDPRDGYIVEKPIASLQFNHLNFVEIDKD